MSALWERIRGARLARVLVVYGGASWLILEVTSVFIEQFGLPSWFFQAAILLLLIGLAVLLTTAWIQSQPAAAADLPSPWEVDLVDLKASVTRGKVPHLTWARAALGGVLAFSLLFGFAGLYVLLSDRGALPGPREAEAAVAPGIAILPFRTVGPEMELWREGMVDLLATNLDGAAGLRTIDPRTVLSAWDRLAGDREGEAERPAAVRIGGAVGARYAILGSAVGTGDDVRLSAEAYDVDSGEIRGRTQVEGDPDSMFALVDALSLEILRAGLISDPARVPDFALQGITTSSLPALKAYLEGEQKYRRSRFREAIADFTRAIDADSTFGLALYRISQAYGWVEPFSDRHIEFSGRSARFADRLPKREALLLHGNELVDALHPASIDTLEELTKLYPDDAEAWQALGEAYFHTGEMRLAPRDRFRQAFSRSLALDPGFGPVYIHLIDDAVIRRDTAKALQLLEAHRRIDPASPHARGLALVQAMAFGDSAAHRAARAALDTAGADALVTVAARFWWAAALHPDAEIEAARAIYHPRHPPRARGYAFWALIRGHAVQGRLREAHESAAELAATLREDWLDYELARFGIRSHLSLHPNPARAGAGARHLATDPSAADRFLIGAFAASQERWSDVERELRALEAGGQAEGGEEASAYAQALRGYMALRRNDSAAAVEGLEAVLPAITDGIVHAVLRFELGRLHLSLDQPNEAERYFKTLELFSQGAGILSTPADYYLGETYEALGDPERAASYYARFVRAWANADPELQAWVERGRTALGRLTSEPRS